MKKIYSKLNTSVLLHQINKLEDIKEEKHELSDPKEFLQIRAMNLKKDRTFTPHAHIWKSGEKKVITQESWIVITGKIEGIFYDTNNEVLAKEILSPGDCAITFQGGHNLTSLEEKTIMYEIKTGPYKGKDNDKIEL